MEYRLFVGTYTEGTGSQGIYTLAMAPGGTPRITHTMGGCVNPSFLALGDGLLYAASEQTHTGGLAAYRIGPGGALAYLNGAEFPGSDTCHLSLWPGGGFVSAASYTSGTFSTLAIEPGGGLGGLVQHIEGSGSGPVADRQGGPHAHSITLSPKGKLFLGCDLGADLLLIWRPDPATGQLCELARLAVPPGEGPRHLAFNQAGDRVYLLTELAANLLVYSLDRETGALALLQSETTLPGGMPAGNTAADVHLSPDGRFVYCSNRGADTLTAFEIGPGGRVANPRVYPAGGKSPRNFGISPDGKFLAVANGVDGTLVFYALDAATGAPGEKLASLNIPGAVCVLWDQPDNTPNA